MLQAIASVQFYPEERSGLLGERNKPVTYVSNVISARTFKRLPSLDELDASTCKSDNAKDTSRSLDLGAHAYTKMIHAMLHRCALQAPLHHTQYFFLLQVYSRLRLQDMRALQIILQRMSICWSLLSLKQLVKVANCVGKLGLGSCTWSKPLSKALEVKLFGCLRVVPSGSGLRSNVDDGVSIGENVEDHMNHAPDRNLENYPFLWSGDREHRPAQQHEEIEIRRQGAPVRIVELSPEHSSGAGSEATTETPAVSSEARQLISTTLKPVTVFELLPDRCADIMKILLDGMTARMPCQGARSVNHRSLVLYELFLQLNKPQGYDNELSDIAKEEIASYRDAFYQRKDLVTDDEESSPEDEVRSDFDYEAHGDRKTSGLELVPEAEFEIELASAASTERKLFATQKVLDHFPGDRGGSFYHRLESGMNAGPFQVDFYSEELNLIIDILRQESYYRGGMEVTANTRWRHDILRGMGFNLRTFDYRDLKSKLLEV